jgi:hypothetical protein
MDRVCYFILKSAQADVRKWPSDLANAPSRQVSRLFELLYVFD